MKSNLELLLILLLVAFSRCGLAENFAVDTAKLLFVGPNNEVVSLYYALEEAERYIKAKDPTIQLNTFERQIWVNPKKKGIQVTYSKGLGHESWTLDLVLDKQFKVIRHRKKIATEPPPPKSSRPEEVIRRN
jgi:hypothetical protein